MSNVKLAIRVRPFTDRELKSEKDKVQVINIIDENNVTITNVKVNVSGAGDSRERVRRYEVDYTFDSACEITNPSYASQETIFDKIGRQVLAGLAGGHPVCVLTYGQSATGKTHTMMGTEVQPGLIPRICKALAEEHPLNVTVSFLEIYNERVHDLLAGEAPISVNSLPRRRGNVRKDLRVREHPVKGPYVQNLRRVTVHDAQSLLAVVAEGARRRRTAVTRRNSSSSRSHALLELVTARSTLHLADLAGSEKGDWEGCGGAGGRQKEGANINKSLVALSNVISALVNAGSGRGRFVPYRDSALTWLLKDCFTGGGSIFIIATLSPSAGCYGESASTLRWAARARQLPIRPALEPPVTSRAALHKKFQQLLSELASHYIRYIPETGKISYDDNHWSLSINKFHRDILATKDTNIGNIMNLRYPKTDERNSTSPPSSVASGSSDIINTMDKNAEISNEINVEIDKLFGPTLERTRSGFDIDVVAPLRHKKRQFRSQEVLFSDKLSPGNRDHRLSDAGLNNIATSQSKGVNDKDGKIPTNQPNVPILYDTQRAEIIASVTERLYSKLKKDNDVIPQKESNETKPVNEVKILQPLNELKICSNARQRLMEMSKKALRNKRRIGIPAHTQTRKCAIRVKEQGIDAQKDLQEYAKEYNYPCKFQCDVGTETIPMTPRLKEIAVGPKYSTMVFEDKCIMTENKQVIHKSSFTMTETLSRRNQYTQTNIQPPPRRRRRSTALSKYLRNIDRLKPSANEMVSSPVININISPMYSVDSESQSSDDISKNNNYAEEPIKTTTTTPDLLTNHNNLSRNDVDVKVNESNVNLSSDDLSASKTFTSSAILTKSSEEFSDTEDMILPHVKVDTTRNVGCKDYEDLIFGRSENLFPYNIKISPRKEVKAKRVIRFKEKDVTTTQCCSSRRINDTTCSMDSEQEKVDSLKDTDSDCSASSDTCPTETNSFIWKKATTTKTFNENQACKSHKANVYKYKTAKNKLKKSVPKKYDEECLCTKSLSDEKYYIGAYKKEHRIRLKQWKYRKNDDDDDIIFDNMERKLISACNSMETAVNKYNDYLVDFQGHVTERGKNESSSRTPKEYLQHLINLRREAVRLNKNKNFQQ